MREFSSHILIDGAGEPGRFGPKAYEDTIEQLLDRIHKSHTGRLLMAEINRGAKKSLWVVPINGVLNAFAGPTDTLHATLKGHLERSGGDGKVLRDAAGHTIKGLGGGSDSLLQFTASTWVKYCKTGQAGHKSGAQADEILFHEMVHAGREMRGLFDPMPLDHLYGTEEEFFAIMVANIYASETGRKSDLRSDHFGFTPLSQNQDSAVKFLPQRDMHDYRYRLLNKFVRQEADLAHALQRVPANFNPVRRYFELQDQPYVKHHSDPD